ncbi:MAG: hypothetical protein L3J74_05495 [Bacteroidales bacterium]|nr:hypothetical protein [Bacteroidales bacterium]
MKQIFLIVLVIFAYSCKTQQNAMQTVKIANNIELNAKKVYSQGEKIIISLKNTTSEAVSILRPMEKFIYKKEGEQWKRVNVMYCPCDASCPPPPEKQELNQNSNLKIIWDQKEDSCSKERINGVRKTIEKQVDTGIYRLEINYETSAGKRERYYYEFEIK